MISWLNAKKGMWNIPSPLISGVKEIRKLAPHCLDGYTSKLTAKGKGTKLVDLWDLFIYLFIFPPWEITARSSTVMKTVRR